MSWGEALAGTHLFSGLPASTLDALGQRATHRRYRTGSVVFVQGERGERSFVIVSGTVKISAYHPDGRELVLAVLGPGDVFGELSPFDHAPRSADATAITDAELLSFDSEAFDDVVRAHPEISQALLAVLAKRLRHANEAFQDIAFFDVAARVARRLSDLADEHGVEHASGVKIDVPLSQESLAQMVGASRETVNKALAGLSRRGLVKRDGRRYVVTDLDALRARAR